MTRDRREEAYRVRTEAAAQAKEREHPSHLSNGDEERFATARYAMSFTKGLHHDQATGLIVGAAEFQRFRRAVDEGYVDAFTAEVRAPVEKARGWEAPTAGFVYDLQGPDAQAVTMQPAPALGSAELAYEMAEVYEMALLRDVPLSELATGATMVTDVDDTIDRLNDLPYTTAGFPGRPRTTEAGVVTRQTLFRGSSPKVDVGPYLSQFMLIGNDQHDATGIDHGCIAYGVQQIDQRVPVAEPQDYMTTEASWLQVQNGANTLDRSTLYSSPAARRFITFPRDLATYVHFDQLYQAYLNACLILLSMRDPQVPRIAPFDPGFAHLSGRGNHFFNSLNLNSNELAAIETHSRQAEGFALYGGPHILTLVTEVATRALKAVRYQKFNVHIRLRPEALAGRIQHAMAIQNAHPHIGPAFTDFEGSIQDTVSAVRGVNPGNAAYLPMAFQEGSPMHPSYGAGHATVAGACVTILKAFFDTSAVLVRGDNGDVFALPQADDEAVHFTPNASDDSLVATTGGTFLTLEGELNKLAANISIARNMAGVHYYSDYYDSLRMGEKIAIGLLQEQALCYPKDPFVLSLPTFDGDVVRIGTR